MGLLTFGFSLSQGRCERGVEEKPLKRVFSLHFWWLKGAIFEGRAGILSGVGVNPHL
jgi:hypothetical protein